MKTIYNKLVRDKIPEIIEGQGKKANYHILSEEEFIEALKDKLIEEAKELKEAKTIDEIIEELVDILEVYYSLMEASDISGGTIYEVGLNKIEKKGGFYKKIFLESVEE